MIKRLIEYLTIERKIEYIQYENSLKSSNARDYTSYSTLKTISIKISTTSKINVVLTIIKFVLTNTIFLITIKSINEFTKKLLTN